MLVHPQDLSRSQRTTFSLYPLLFKPSKCLHIEPKSRTCHALVAALAAEVQVPLTVHDTEEDDGSDGSTATSAATTTTTTTKPKKGKAALPLKRDRVGYLQFLLLIGFFFLYLKLLLSRILLYFFWLLFLLLLCSS